METENTTTTETKPVKKKSPRRIMIMGGILVIIILIVVRYFVMGSSRETTDNAQLDGDIIPIRSSVSGYIKTIHFKDNEPVKKGQLLITLDDVDLKARVAQAQAALENARANLLSVKSNANAVSLNANATVFSSEAIQQNVVSAKARMKKAEDDFARMQNMLQAKAATQSQYDAAKTELDVARAQYDATINQYKSSTVQSKGIYSQAQAQQAQITLAEALVSQRQAELELAQTQLDYATVEAPCDGVVSRRAVEEGQYITIGQPLCSTIDNHNLWVTANFKETQLENLKIGQAVHIKVDAFPDMEIEGKVESFVGATGAKFSLLPPDNSTGNFVKVVQRVPVRIAITRYPENKAMLFPGLSAFVEVTLK